MTTRTPGHSAAHTPEALHTILEDAFNSGDVDALVDAYEEDAVLVVPKGPYVRGRDNIRAAKAPVLALGPHFTSVVQKVLQTDGLALTYARWELVGPASDHTAMRLSGRGTTVSRRRPDGTWGIVLDDPLSPGFP
jgi:uncharacterized protein (TIGR02246 family)